MEYYIFLSITIKIISTYYTVCTIVCLVEFVSSSKNGPISSGNGGTFTKNCCTDEQQSLHVHVSSCPPPGITTNFLQTAPQRMYSSFAIAGGTRASFEPHITRVGVITCPIFFKDMYWKQISCLHKHNVTSENITPLYHDILELLSTLRNYIFHKQVSSHNTKQTLFL